MYQRPAGLERLLNSLVKSLGGETHNVDIIYSLELGYTQENLEIIKKYKVHFSKSSLLKNSYKLGVDKHFLECIARTNPNSLNLIFEDDHLCVPGILNYLHFFKTFKGEAAAFSLYSYELNPSTGLPFLPIKKSGDFYFYQRITSRGLVLNAAQSSSFVDWLKGYKSEHYRYTIPPYIEKYTDQIWETLFTKYLIQSNQNVLFPYRSTMTAFGDKGVHFRQTYDRFVPQVELSLNQKMELSMSEEMIEYDAWGELKPRFFVGVLDNDYLADIQIDLNGTKTNIDKSYVLTCYPVKHAIKSFAIDLKPMEMNVLLNIDGNDIHLAKLEDVKQLTWIRRQRWRFKMRLYHNQRYGIAELMLHLIRRLISNSFYSKYIS